jgi:hypothetical protein
MRTPLRFSWIMVDTLENCSWICSKRRWMCRPKARTRGGRQTRGTMESPVSRGLIHSISARANTKPTTVFMAYMMAGPAAMRTARVSLVARAMMSPVRLSP